MATLSAAEIKKVAAQAGFSGNDLNIAVAVAFAESSGNPSATNQNRNGSVDYGLWQINSIHKAILAKGNWSDPATNAKMAYQVFSEAGHKWRPWVAYNSGSYLVHLPKARAATIADSAGGAGGALGDAARVLVPGTNLLPGVGGAVDGLQAAVGLAGFLMDPRNWLRLVYALAGGLLVLFALSRIGLGSSQVKAATGALAKVKTA